MLKIGDKAPDFNLRDENKNSYSLNTLKGQKILLYFYPKDDTTGCTIEACKFNDKLDEFKKLGIVVLGIGKGDEKSHIKFKTKYNLNFDLLIDPNYDICKNYFVLKEKSMFGKKYLGIERTTFLINEDGIIKMIWMKVNPLNHTDNVLNYLKNLE